MEPAQLQPVTYTFGPFHLIPEEMLLLREGEPVPLPPKVWETLVVLVANHGHLVTKEDLLKRVWPETFVEEGSLTRCVSQLRKVLDSEASGREYIQTVPTKGYRFVAEVAAVQTRSGRPRPAVLKLEPAGPLVERTQGSATDSSPPPPIALTAGGAIALPKPSGSIPLHSPVETEPAPKPESVPAPVAGQASANEARHPRRIPRWVMIQVAVVFAAGFIYWLSRPLPPLKVAAFQQITNDGQGKLDAFRGGVPGALLTDGSRLYFAEISGSTLGSAQVGVLGGQTLPMGLPPLIPDLVLLQIYPDDTQFLATVHHKVKPENPFWTLSVPDLTPRQLGGLQGHDGTWSPDGRSFVFAQAHNLYQATSDGASPIQLVSLPGIGWWPRFSPDGRRLRFNIEDEKSQSLSLWEVSSDGSNLHPLLPDWRQPPNECCGSWTPDGHYYVFQSTQGVSTGLWVLRDERSLLRKARLLPVKLTEGPMDFWAPTPSRDGSKIFAVGEQRRGELVRYDGTTDQFSPYLSGISADHVEFSKDRQWIAYAAFPDATIWRSRPDESDRLQLSFPPLQALFPRWSPDGKRIAFLGFEPGGPMRVYLVSLGGSAPEPMLPGETMEVDPNWSPDGNQIMFGSVQPPGHSASEASGSIQILDLRTHQVSSLPGSEGLTAPRWSPDGRYVTAGMIAQPKSGEAAVRLYDFSTGKWTPFEQDPDRQQVVVPRREVFLLRQIPGNRSGHIPPAPLGPQHRKGGELERRPACLGKLRMVDGALARRRSCGAARHQHRGDLRTGFGEAVE